MLAASPEERHKEKRARAAERESTASRLKAMKRKKERETKHYVNVPLDYETKRALENAAHEHGLKMAEIVRDAMKVYLRDAGYLDGDNE